MTKPLTENELYKSFKFYEAYVENEIRHGRMDKSIARVLIDSARRNYRNQNHNKELEKAKCG